MEAKRVLSRASTGEAMKQMHRCAGCRGANPSPLSFPKGTPEFVQSHSHRSNHDMAELGTIYYPVASYKNKEERASQTDVALLF